MRFEPRDYQRRAIEHVRTLPACALHVGMGLGKTVAVLTALDHLMLLGEVRRVLVLAPLRVAASTWPGEIAKWDHLQHLTIAVAAGSAADRRNAIAQDAMITCVNYDNVAWLVEQYGATWPWDTVIADESSRLKNPSAKRFKALRSVRARQNSPIKRWINLTGTPAPNGLLDLWSQVYLLDSGQRLGNRFYTYRARYFRPSGYKGYKFVPYDWTQGKVEEQLADLCLTLQAKDYFELPPLVENDIFVDLPAEAAEIYRLLERDFFVQLTRGTVDAATAAVLSMKCLQAASGALYLDDEAAHWETIHNAKIEALTDVIEEAAGAPVLVAYHWQSDLVRLREAFPEAQTLDTHGKVIDAWNRGEVPLLLVHPASCGHGLNLQDGGNILVFFSHWWALEEYQQVIERIGPTRQAQSGHPRPVFVHHLFARDTVDEAVRERRWRKATVQQSLLDHMRRVSADTPQGQGTT